MVNEWTRNDLPTEDESAETYMAKGVYSVHEGIALVLDAVVDHLNAHHPKPVPGMLSSAADCVLNAEDRARSAKADRDRWRRAHEIVEGERDQARAERDEAVARAEAAEARTAVTSEDVEGAIRAAYFQRGFGYTSGDIEVSTDAVCDLFGIETGQAADPLLDKAQEFAALADWELTDREAELLHTVAAHVLGQEAER